jgi:lysophospholipid acyltransferase (LPLAT)-like uncharacterized protein
MKIRHPALLRALAFLTACLIQLWIRTLDFRYRPLGSNVDPHFRGLRGRYIYAFWHENMLLLAYHYARPDMWVLISQHADGQLIADVCRYLGFRTVRGSTTRGGASAMRQMFRLSSHGHIAITPDGPRGPRRKVQQGLVYLAAHTGLPIVPVGVAYSKAWRMRSWDRFALPMPFGRGVCITDEPIEVPSHADRTLMAEYVQRVEAALHRVSKCAEGLAETGRWDARYVPSREGALASVNGRG